MAHMRAGLLFSSLALAISLVPFGALAQLSQDPVTDAMLQNPADGDWLMWRRTLNGWGYSPLDQINRSNVASLKLAWSTPLNAGSVQEGTPVVHNGVLYMPHPGDVITAMNASTGEKLWEHRREIPEDIGDYIPATETERSLAIYGDTILFTSNDDYIVGLDAKTGEQKW